MRAISETLPTIVYLGKGYDLLSYDKRIVLRSWAGLPVETHFSAIPAAVLAIACFALDPKECPIAGNWERVHYPATFRGQSLLFVSRISGNNLPEHKLFPYLTKILDWLHYPDPTVAEFKGYAGNDVSDLLLSLAWSARKKYDLPAAAREGLLKDAGEERLNEFFEDFNTEKLVFLIQYFLELLPKFKAKAPRKKRVVTVLSLLASLEFEAWLHGYRFYSKCSSTVTFEYENIKAQIELPPETTLNLGEDALNLGFLRFLRTYANMSETEIKGLPDPYPVLIRVTSVPPHELMAMFAGKLEFRGVELAMPFKHNTGVMVASKRPLMEGCTEAFALPCDGSTRTLFGQMLKDSTPLARGGETDTYPALYLPLSNTLFVHPEPHHAIRLFLKALKRLDKTEQSRFWSVLKRLYKEGVLEQIRESEERNYFAQDWE